MWCRGLRGDGCRRHAAWAGQIVSALELQSVTVTGTDAAATVLPQGLALLAGVVAVVEGVAAHQVVVPRLDGGLVVLPVGA